MINGNCLLKKNVKKISISVNVAKNGFIKKNYKWII